MKIDFSRGKTAIFIGSSVCEGCGATNNRGWTAMTAERMERNGWTTGAPIDLPTREAVDETGLGYYEDKICKNTDKPAVCFVGLGLSNEGLATAPDPAVPCGIFLNNLKKIVQALKDAGIFPIVGGVYPNNDYTLMQYAWERRVYDEMDTWDVPVLQWLDGLEDGYGHYPKGWENDPWHPNDEGYKHYYEQIPQKVWDLLECPKP